MAVTRLAVGVAWRPYAGEVVSGDGWQCDQHLETDRVAVIDGLGHGPEAHAAAEAARATLREHPELEPAAALSACHRVLLGTRGAAMWVARVDLPAKRLTYAGVGNVEARLWGDGREQRLVAQRGIVGREMIPAVRTYEVPLVSGWLLMIYSDGIRDRFDLSSLHHEFPDELQGLADRVLNVWGEDSDDATVLVIRAQ